jgi:hypothetical protein
MALVAGVILVIVFLSSDRPALVADFNKAGLSMLSVYLPYTVIILLAFALRLIPSVDLRSFTSIIVFGPAVLIRPLIAGAGIIWGIIASPKIEVIIPALLALLAILSLGRLLDWRQKLLF